MRKIIFRRLNRHGWQKAHKIHRRFAKGQFNMNDMREQLDQMLRMGLPAESVDASLTSERHDHIHTTYLLLQRRIAAPQPPAANHLVPPAVRLVAQQRCHLSPLPEPPEDALHLLRMLAQLPLPPKEPQHALPQRVSIFLVLAGRHGRVPHHHQVGVLVGQAGQADALVGEEVHVGIGHHDPLGGAGGAAREEDADGVAGGGDRRVAQGLRRDVGSRWRGEFPVGCEGVEHSVKYLRAHHLQQLRLLKNL